MSHWPSKLCLVLLATASPTVLYAQAEPTGATQQQNPIPGPVGNPAAAPGPSPGEPGFTAQLFTPERSSFLGDIYGLRTTLGRYGVSLGLEEISEVFGNVTGGYRQGAAYHGLSVLSMGIDTGPLGWEGGVFNISAFQIHGRPLSSETLGSLQTVNGIEAARSTRIWELWFQQSFLAGQADVKIGQQSLDTEFMISSLAGTFINAALGWPVLPSSNLYAGGPAFPLASLGVRLRARPTEALTVLGGVFDDNPPGGSFTDDSQLRGGAQSGTAFNLGTGALFIAEAQYAINQSVSGDSPDAANRRGLPGTYKFGGWYDTGAFRDQRFDQFGTPLADPSSTGQARIRHHNFSLYATADQVVWQPDLTQTRSVGVFARLMGGPGDRNAVEFAVNAGVVLKGPFAGRDGDSVGLAYGLANIGRSARLASQDISALSGGPVRSSESFIEATYQYQIAPWWQLQPDFQYVFLPNGGVPNPRQPGKRISNEAIFGLRTNIVF